MQEGAAGGTVHEGDMCATALLQYMRGWFGNTLIMVGIMGSGTAAVDVLVLYVPGMYCIRWGEAGRVFSLKTHEPAMV